MGLNQRGGNSSNKTFLTVYGGSLVIQYDDKEDLVKKIEALGLDSDGIKTRKKTKGKNEGKEVFYYEFSSLDGNLNNISIQDKDWGEQVELELVDVEETFIINLGDPFGRIAKDFIKRIPNVDLSEEVTIGVWNITKEESSTGKSYSGVWMRQGDTKIEHAISREELPEATQKKRGKTVTWDFSEQETYLYNKLTSYIDENFNGSSESQPTPKPKAVEKFKEEEIVDDLPF